MPLFALYTSRYSNRKDMRALDVGCGFTGFFRALPFGEMHSVDICIDDLRAAGFVLPKQGFFHRASAERLPFESESFDFVCCANGIDHYERPSRSLFEMFRVLRPGGLLLLTLDVFKEDKGRRDKKHPHSYTWKKLRTQLRLVGKYEVVFERLSPVRAQLHRFVKSGTVLYSSDRQELVLLVRKL